MSQLQKHFSSWVAAVQLARNQSNHTKQWRKTRQWQSACWRRKPQLTISRNQWVDIHWIDRRSPWHRDRSTVGWCACKTRRDSGSPADWPHLECNRPTPRRRACPVARGDWCWTWRPWSSDKTTQTVADCQPATNNSSNLNSPRWRRGHSFWCLQFSASSRCKTWQRREPQSHKPNSASTRSSSSSHGSSGRAQLQRWSYH